MAYTRLLRAYYRREKPFSDSTEACRLIRATTKAQRSSVEVILGEFFISCSDGFRNKRADQEIEQYQAQSDTNRRIAHSRIVQRTVNEPSTKRDTNRTPNQEPLTTNQYPEPLTKDQKHMSGKPDATPPESKKFNGSKALAVQVLDFLNEQTGRAYRPVDANIEIIVARLKEGYTVADIRKVIVRKCDKWRGDDKMDEYLRPATLFNKTNLANYSGELVVPK